jgi:hypothetical protein
MSYHLPAGYVERTTPGYWDGHKGSGRIYQWHVYQYAVEVCRTYKLTHVLDVGCGDGDKVAILRAAGLHVMGLVENHSQVPAHLCNAFDDGIFQCDLSQPAWDTIVPLLHLNTLILCADVVEHLVEPDILMDGLRWFNRRVLLSTPAREYIYGPDDRLGPPLNTLHMREWSSTEFPLYVNDFFDVVYHKIVPQYYDPNARLHPKGPKGTQIVECVPKVHL